MNYILYIFLLIMHLLIFILQPDDSRLNHKNALSILERALFSVRAAIFIISIFNIFS